ncbi:MAG: S9 family peptidase, partial [Candidatus Aminicenantes bacterium]|nr:S9 family peptidase [Candidatus Aminicenantes bacterium]
MKKTNAAFVIFLWVLVLSPSLSAQSGEEAAATPRVLEDIKDILAWKSIRSPVVSRDGRWFAYRLSPQEGDGEVIVRSTDGEKEFKLPAGEAPDFAEDLLFSADSKWAAFTIYPKKEEARKLKKEKKKAYNKAALLNLASGEKTEFDRVEKFAFSGEASAWLALHKYAPETKETPPAEPKDQDRWRG